MRLTILIALLAPLALVACADDDELYPGSDYDETYDLTPQYRQDGPENLGDDMPFDDTLEDYTEDGFEVEVTE